MRNVRTEVSKMAVTEFGEITERLRRSTVVVRAGRHGVGSGVIWSSGGCIVTNAHVARSSQLSLRLWDGREFDATITSRDLRRDLAALRIHTADLPSVLVADLSQVRAGELAIAIGNPLGFVGALTTGVIHSVGPVHGLGPQPWVQANVRLAPGNSGGPLADARGRVIGINTMTAGRLALAIPSNVVRGSLSAVPSDAWLGVTIRPVRIPRSDAAEGFGLLLLEVESHSPASHASLLPGDILLGTEERAFKSVGDLAKVLEGSGQRLVRLEFLRGDYPQIRCVTVQLGRQHVARGSVAA